MGLNQNTAEPVSAQPPLVESDEQYKKLVELSPDVIAIFYDAKIEFINRAGVELYGAYTSEEMIGKSILDFFHPDSLQEGMARLMDLAAGANGTAAKLKFLRKDGSTIDSEARAMPVVWKGKPSALAILRDITHSQRAENALLESEKRYRTLASVSPVGLFRTNPLGKSVFVNDYLCEIFGRSREEILESDGISNIHPNDAEAVRKAWGESVKLDLSFKTEFRIIRPDGIILWVTIHSQSEKKSDGVLQGFIGTVTDITERKHAEILLDCQKKTLAQIAQGKGLQVVMDELAVCIGKISNEGSACVFRIEPGSENLNWLSAPEIPASFREAVPTFSPDLKSGAIGLSIVLKARAHSSNMILDSHWTCGRKEAMAHGFRACASIPIFGSGGIILGAFVLFFPFTHEPSNFDIQVLETAAGLAGIAMERERQEDLNNRNLELSKQNQRIRDASRMKSEFIASMSHELRTPLNAILGFTQILIDSKVGTLIPKQKEYLGDILDGGMHLLRLINGILDLAKIEAGKMQLAKEFIPVETTIREVCDIIVPMAMNKNVKLEIDVQLTQPNFKLDSQKFRQILYNLISNAIKFSHDDNKVCVMAKLDENQSLCVQVKDFGIGIKQTDLKKLFQEFQQLDSGSTRHYPGTGLGLVITKKLVELHQGSVTVESEFGKGSLFSAVFPQQKDLL